MGSEVVVTQEDDFVISVVDVTHPGIVFRYGHPGEPGSEPGYLHNPDDAMLTPGGAILSADIKNCRIVVIRPPAHRVAQQLGETGNCTHELGVSYGSPNGAFPMSNGDTVVTEINGDWIDVLRPRWEAGHGHPPARLQLSLGYQRGAPRRVPLGRLHRSGCDRDVHGDRPAAVALRTHGRRCARSALACVATAERGCARQRRQERSRDRDRSLTPTGSSGSTATPTNPVRGLAIWPTPMASISRRRTP